MSQKIDEAGYESGRAAFANGASFRSIVEQSFASETSDDPEADTKAMSGALGFVDALLDMLRGSRA